MSGDAHSNSVLQTRDLAVGYGSTKLAQHLNLALHQGELVALLGPNGAGKTTLLRTLSGMQSPLAGEVLIAGKDVSRLQARELAQHLSIVLTDRPPLGMMTGYELVALGRHPHTDWSGRLREQDRERVDWAVDAVGATPFAARAMTELSDGQRQKLMIARALAQETPLLLLDEPTAFLDLPRRVELMRLLRDCARDLHRAVLLSTHDLDLALRTADRLWLFSEAGEVHDGAPEDLILSGAFAKIFLDAGIDGVEFDASSGTFQLTQPPRGTVMLKSEADALKTQWTQRALERAGYQVINQSMSNGRLPAAQITVTSSGWHLAGTSGTSVYASLYDLIRAVSTLTESESSP
jgi:iron complex transport system ATP-binding protein